MVEPRSSTSSSDRSGWFPWAAAVAVVSVLILDALLLGGSGPWGMILSHVPITNPSSHITARERAWLAEGSPPGQKVAVVLGTSRGMAGFSEPFLEEQVPNLDVVKLARPGHLPFQTRSLIEDLVDAKPDVVVFPLSEFNTHRPIRIEPVAGRGTANVRAIVNLLTAAGPGFAWENRTTVLRLFGAATLNGYRFREVLGLAGLYRLRRFTRQDFGRRDEGGLEPHAVRPFQAGREPIAFWEEAMAPMPEEQLQEISRQFGGPLGPTVRTHQTPMVREITAGSHGPIQYALVRQGVDRLLEAGIEVVIVETPLHSVSAELYDVGLRTEFLELARELSDKPGVTFVSLDESGPFVDEDFGDILHLGDLGQDKLSRAVLPALRASLAGSSADSTGAPAAPAAPGH